MEPVPSTQVSHIISESVSATTSADSPLQPVSSDSVVSPSMSETTEPPLFTFEDLPPLSSPVHTVSSPAASSASATEPTLPAVTANSHSMVTRGKEGIRKPNPRYILLTVPSTPSKPRTVTTTLKHPGWNAAMTKEIDTFKKTGTYSLVPYQPDMNILGCKWVFRTKLQADGALDKLKARLCVKGFDQEEYIDYLETYNPMVKIATVRSVLHTATVLKWDIKQLDVKNAFLHGDLSKTVYMHQPLGFIDPNHPGHV